MAFWNDLFGLIRNKRVGPPIVAVALILAAVAFLVGSPRYKIESSLILTAPPSGGTLSMDPTKPVGLTNPLLQYNDGLRTVAGILILALNSKDELRKLGVTDGGSTEIVIDDGRSNADLMGVVTQGPFIHIKVEAKEEATANDVLKRAERRLREELTSYQGSLGAPKSTFIAVNDVALIPVEYDGSGKLQLAAEALVALLLLGFGGAYLISTGRVRGRPAPVGAPVEDQEPEVRPEAEVRPEPAKGPALNGSSAATASSSVQPEDRDRSEERDPDDPPTEEFTRITDELLKAVPDPRKPDRDGRAG
jgi:hypothetical protein